ncbi:MAG TPA: YXWGXW repeat-containing protein [Terriglobia bacterium]
MKTFLLTTLMAVMLVTSVPVFGAQVSFGIRIGPPPAPRVAVVPVRPGPDYTWVEGYWYPVGSHYKWHQGYWTRAPYGGARWVGPHYEGGRYFQGYWNGERGRIEHDHHWDKHRERDFHHEH